jgi:hypothetical protein
VSDGVHIQFFLLIYFKHNRMSCTKFMNCCLFILLYRKCTCMLRGQWHIEKFSWTRFSQKLINKIHWIIEPFNELRLLPCDYLTPKSRGFLWELMLSQLVKKCPSFVKAKYHCVVQNSRSSGPILRFHFDIISSSFQLVTPFQVLRIKFGLFH